MPPKRKLKGAKGQAANIPRSLSELEVVLRTFLGGAPGQFPPEQIDQQIRNATATLKAFIKEPASVPALFSRIAMNDSPADTRQLACVLLCKNIGPFWTGLQKSHMLGQANKSDASLCREYITTILHNGDAPPSLIHSLSYLTSIILRLDIKKNRWFRRCY